MMNFNQALAVLKKDEEEERNWRSARAKLTEVLAAAIAADVALEPVTQQKAALESDVAALRASFAKLDGDFQMLQRRHARLDEEHQAKHHALDASLSTARADLAAVEQLKRDTEVQLAELTTKWHLKMGQASGS